MTAHDIDADGTDLPPPARAGRLAGVPYRWVAMGVVLFGTFMVVLDTTIVNLGLPSMQRDFETVTGVEWVVTAYLIAVGVTQMTSGWVGDRIGRRHAFIASLVIFTLASAACAVAPTLETLVVARVLQGIGGGLLIPVAMAMIYELFEPHERGRALGYFGIAVMAAPAIGPVLGGGVVSSVGWRWLFLINIPVGVAGVPIALRLLRDTGFRQSRPFDFTGLVVAGSGLVALLIGFQQGGSWGWTSTPVLALIGSGLVLMAWFTRHSVTRDAPLVEMRIFANPVFAISMVAIGLMTVAQYGRLVYIPLELAATRGISELRIGFVMLPAALGIAATMPIGGRLADRVGSRTPYAIGAVVLLASFVPLATISQTTHLATIAVALFIGGLGSGLAMMAPNVVAMNAVTTGQVGQATGLSQVSRQVFAALGTAVLASIFTAYVPDAVDLGAPGVVDDAIGAYNTVFVATLVVLAAAVVVAFFLPGRTRALELQRDRSAERVVS